MNVSITLTIEAPDAIYEPVILQIAGKQVAKRDGVFNLEAFDIEAMKLLAADAIRRTFTAGFLAEQKNQLKAEK